MSRSITLSPKHGVNATIPVCIFCGKPRNEIALLGRIKDTKKVKTAWGGESTIVKDPDMEAPMYSVIDYEPCDECKANMSLGVTLIGVTTTQPDDCRPPLTAQDKTSVYPTGSWCVLKPEAAQRIFHAEFKCGDKLFVEQPILTQLTGGEN